MFILLLDILAIFYTMDAKRVMATIYNYGNFSSTNDLIDSLEHISRIQPEMYMVLVS